MNPTLIKAVLLILVSALLSPVSLPATERPNVILIMVDDLGYECVTANGGQSYQTPNIDKLAATGVRFTNCHVPLIVSWPAVIQGGGRVCTDLVSSTDFLPTICSAAGIDVPANMDGVSFLPQLRGQSGSPRQWLYSWYSPRQRLDLTVKECAFDERFKLYRSGQFYDVKADPEETQDLASTSLAGNAATAKAKLQSVLDQFQDARPTELDRQFEASGNSKANRN